MGRNFFRGLLAGAAIALLPAVAAAHPRFPPREAQIVAPYPAAKTAAEGKTYRLGALVIEAPWTRATPGGVQVAGGYLKVTNTGSAPDRLVGGEFAPAQAVEVHEMAMADGIMRMRRLDKGLEIAPGKTVELKPGGYHLMFTGLRERLTQGRSIRGRLTFEKAGTIEVEFRVAPIGAPSRGHSHH